jgi:hypothetical protein
MAKPSPFASYFEQKQAATANAGQQTQQAEIPQEKPFVYPDVEAEQKNRAFQEKLFNDSYYEARAGGLSETEARKQARLMVENQKNETMLAMKKKLVDAQTKAHTLQVQQDEATAQSELIDFTSSLSKLDTQDLRGYQDGYKALEDANHKLLYHPNPQIREIAQQTMAKAKKEHEDYSQGAVTSAKRYGYDAFPIEALDEKGKPDMIKLAEIGVPHFNAIQEQRRKDAIADQLSAAKQLGASMEPSSITTSAEGEPRVSFENTKQKIDAARRSYQVQQNASAEEAATTFPYPGEEQSNVNKRPPLSSFRK